MKTKNIKYSSGQLPTDKRTANEIIDEMRLSIRGCALEQAYQKLKGKDLIYAANAIKEELGVTNEELCKFLGY